MGLYRKIKKLLVIVFAVILTAALALGLYASDYYHAELDAIQDLSLTIEYGRMERLEDGSMASFTADNTAWVEGLILLAAYSAEELDVPVLSIYGSGDGVLDLEKYEKYRTNLPDDLTEVILEGGNHAGFGLYGRQDGDGTAAITSQEQMEQTAKLIAAFVK